MHTVASTINAPVCVFGLYDNFHSLRMTTLNLRQLGFINRDFSVLFREEALQSRDSNRDLARSPVSTDGCFSALIGGTLDSLTYLPVTEYGVVASAVMSLGVPRYEAEEYEIGIRKQKTLLCARSSSSAFGDLAMQVFLRSGAECVLAAPQFEFPEAVEGVGISWLDPAASLQARFLC